MILEIRSALLILALYFLCACCDKDDASTAQETAITVPEASRDFGSTENVASSAILDPESTRAPTSLVTDDLESTESLTTAADHETSTEPRTTQSFLETEATAGGTPSSTVPQTTKSISTTLAPEDTTSVDNNTVICDPATWPVNASADAREVFNLTVDAKSIEWISLSWEAPCPNVSVAYSIDRYIGESVDQSVKIDSRIIENVTRHNATDLDPCAQYTFSVRVITEFWISDGSNVTETTDDAISDIGNVLDLTHNVSVNMIELVWQAPAARARCISNYSITQCNDRSSCSEIVVSATNYTASDLEPCTEYHFTVKTVTPTVESTGVNDTAKTTSPKLSLPHSPTIIPGNFSLMVEWQPPKIGASCLKHYRVTVEPSDFIFNITETNVTIARLHACMMYHVHLSAVNENDDEGDTVTVSGETLNYRTNPPVVYGYPLYSANVSNISIVWNINKENNNCFLKNVVTVCNCTARNGTGYDCVNGTSRVDVKSRNATIITVTSVVIGLSPFTSYVCSAFTVSSGGASNESDLVHAITAQDVPSEPIVLPIEDNGDSWFFLTWKQPNRVPGILAGFEIILKWEPLYHAPPWCSKKSVDPVQVDELTYAYNYTKAKAFAKYAVRVRAKTGAGWGSPGEPQTFHTKHKVPEAITRMSPPIIAPSLNDTNVLDTILTWGPPCSLNGNLEGYNVSVYGIRDKYEAHNFSVMHPCTEYTFNGYMCSINLNELKGEYNYTFEISAKVEGIGAHGPSESQFISYPAGIPPQPSQSYIEEITIDPYKAHRSTSTVTVLLPLFLDTNGDIKHYAVMVAMAEHNRPSYARFDLDTNNTWPDTPAWKEAMESDFAITYQATWKNWYPYPDQIADYGHMRAIQYTIGDDVSCKDISSRTEKPTYCNGPLKPDTWYHVRVRAFTNGGYTDSNVFVVKTSSELNVALVIGAVFGIFVVGILVTMMLLVRKCSPYIVLQRFLHSDMPGSPVPAPYTRKKFISHCQQLIDNPGKLSNEFRLLQTLSVDLQMPTNTACLQANRKKNRYSDILPYDFSRVKLEVIDNDPNTDYINASFIRGYTGDDEYIACQGPKEETTYDFWRMVDQYNINIIVMLTQLVEKGKEKCHQYYPTIRETFRYENMTIRCTSELDYRTHTQRTLVLQKENKKRNIIHLHFKDWPDHDVPDDFDAMINFCQIIRRNINANKGYVVVHCSAGIGRTGTLIAIDILLQHLRDNRKLDVFGTVYRLRHHRINMVQRESQYAYIYNCIKQVLKNPYFLKTYKPPPVDPVYEKAGISKNAKDTMNTDMNLVNNLEISKRHSESTESLESNSSSRSTNSPTGRPRASAKIRGLKHYKSMGVINVKTPHLVTLGRSRTLDCVFYKSLGSSSAELNAESVTQESLPLVSCSRSTQDVLGDGTQSADGVQMKETMIEP